ncbi:hypothetical protein [uncultured Microbacterium sp.]|uniref:hypothetical protein n=1 Tax=uncultured Microbacterium sp. TaxID=191216 RepID=UPI0025D550FA|nr:hypothetical protein [uncultured Microbacterium sp.]
MVTIRYAAGMIAVLCWVITFVTLNVDGVTVLATLMVVAWLWTFGVFTRRFWFGDAATNTRLAEVDESLDFEASVLGDLFHLNDENGR